MAIETVTVDSGTGLDVAVDTGTEGAVQLVKLALSADGSTDLITADAGGLLVNLGANNDVTVTGSVAVTGPLTDTQLRATPVPVSGTVTSNAGTNLNTSLLALEAGGNLAAIATSLAALDNAVAGNEFQVDVLTLPALAAGTANIGDVDVLTVPADPFGANADAASATTSISAKLRGIATAIGVTALDLGSGTGGSRTLRTFQDTAQFVGGTGTDTSATQRVSLATNVPLPTGTNSIGAVTQATAASLNMTEASAAGILTAVQLIDDGVYVDDTATHATGTSKGYGIMAAATPTDSAVNANDIGMLAMTVDRKLHVAVMDALPAGTNAIGKLAANSAVDIGDVDVTSIIPGTGATNLGKAEDSGHTTADVGVMSLQVRNDANASFGADLDYTPTSCDAGGNTNVKSRKHLVEVVVTSAGLTTTAAAYVAGDQVGTEFAFAGCARDSGGTGTIVGCILVSAADTTGAFDLIISNATISPAADNATVAFSDADALKIRALINLAAAYDIGNNRIAQAFNLNIPYKCAVTSLFGYLVTRAGIAATPFAAPTDIQITLLVELN